MSESVDNIAAIVVDECIRIHRNLGPGLLESVYETVLAGALKRRGIKIDRQVPVDIQYDGLNFAGAFRVDLLISDGLILEIKSVERLTNLHAKQLLTYLRLTNRSLGLLLNFFRRDHERGHKTRREQSPLLTLRAFAPLRAPE